MRLLPLSVTKLHIGLKIEFYLRLQRTVRLRLFVT